MDDGNLKVDLPEQDEQNRDAEQKNAVKPTRQQVVDIRSKDHQNVVNPPSSSPQPSSSVAGRGEEREPVLMQQIQHLGQSSGSGSSSAGVVSGMMNVVQDNEGRRGVKIDDKELLHPQELVDNTPSIRKCTTPPPFHLSWKIPNRSAAAWYCLHDRFRKPKQYCTKRMNLSCTGSTGEGVSLYCCSCNTKEGEAALCTVIQQRREFFYRVLGVSE